MSADQDRAVTLCNAAQDITRQISSLMDELKRREQPRHGGVEHDQVRKAILRVRDQIMLLTGVVNELDQLESGTGPGAAPGTGMGAA